jgi:hypothetical protein
VPNKYSVTKRNDRRPKSRHHWQFGQKGISSSNEKRLFLPLCVTELSGLQLHFSQQLLLDDSFSTQPKLQTRQHLTLNFRLKILRGPTFF